MIINLKIKFFPASANLYLYCILIHIFFMLMFTINIYWIKTELTQEKKDSKILLMMPKNLTDAEEKVDLIFNQLSLNDKIDSVEKKDVNQVKALLSDVLKDTDLNEEIIPEVYNLIVKSKQQIDLDILNRKISKIMPSARVFSNNNADKFYMKEPYILLFISILLYVIINYFFTNIIIYKIKNYLSLSRTLGVDDQILFKNLNIGFFFILFISFFLCYIIYFLFMDYSQNSFLQFDESLKIYMFVCLSYYLYFLFNFNIQLYNFLKRKI